jgi:hypothetical protein
VYVYIIISKIGSAYFEFVSTFYAMREAQGNLIKNPLLSPFVML